MTNTKFQEMCEQVLIPRLGDFMFHQLKEVHETLEIFADELKRVGDRLDKIVGYIDRHSNTE
jgi:hypothetical protein